MSNERPNRINIWFVAFCAAVTGIGGFLFGYDTAVISGTIGNVAAQFGLDDANTGWYVGCALVGSILGVAIAGRLSARPLKRLSERASLNWIMPKGWQKWGTG